MSNKPYQPSDDIPLPTSRKALEAFAKAWINTAAFHLGNEEYWRARAQKAEAELSDRQSYAAYAVSCARSGEKPDSYEEFCAKMAAIREKRT